MRAFQIAQGQPLHHLFRHFHDFHHFTMPVNPLEQKALQIGEFACHAGRKANDWCLRIADIFGTGDFIFGKAVLSFTDHILDHRGDQPPVELIDHTALAQAGMFQGDFLDNPPNQRDTGQIGEAEQAGA